MTDNDAFDAAGMRFEVVEPFTELTVPTTGHVVLLDDPLRDGRSPGRLHREPPRRRAPSTSSTGALGHVRRRARPARRDARARSSPAATTSSWSRRRARSQVGDDRWELHGFGLRDHSWGPRYWQAPWYYRWLTANFGPGFGFMGSRIARRDGDGTRGGFVWDGERLHLCTRLPHPLDLGGRRPVPPEPSKPSSSPPTGRGR